MWTQLLIQDLLAVSTTCPSRNALVQLSRSTYLRIYVGDSGEQELRRSIREREGEGGSERGERNGGREKGTGRKGREGEVGRERVRRRKRGERDGGNGE